MINHNLLYFTESGDTIHFSCYCFFTTPNSIPNGWGKADTYELGWESVYTYFMPGSFITINWMTFPIIAKMKKT